METCEGIQHVAHELMCRPHPTSRRVSTHSDSDWLLVFNLKYPNVDIDISMYIRQIMTFAKHLNWPVQ